MMKYRGVNFQISQALCLLLYYCFAFYLPISGKYYNIGGRIRAWLCKRIFKECGNHVNIERKATFGSGRNICIGDYSGIGINACIPSNTNIGRNVMMGPNVYILARNHRFDRTDIPMQQQGFTENKQTIIEDDVWIGRDVLMMPGRNIKKGTIIGGGCVLTKDFPEYSIVGGNPSKLIRSRLVKNE